MKFLRVVFGRHELKPINDNKEIGMASWTFWKRSLERAVKTAAQFMLVFLGSDALNILEQDLIAMGGFALAGAVVSILTSIASAPFADKSSPSLV